MSYRFFISVLFALSLHGAFPNDTHPPFTINETRATPLTGEWNLVMGKFLTYAEVKDKLTAASAYVPGIWNEVSWKDSIVGPFGYGTYFTTVIVPKTFTGDLAIEVPEISIAYRLYINETLVGAQGTPGKSKEEEEPRIDHSIYKIDVQPNDTLRLIFHVSNFRQTSGGLWYEPRIAPAHIIQRRASFNGIIKHLILGMLIIAGIYQLYIYFIRKEEKYGLYFFLVCTTLIMLSLTRGDMPFMDLFPDTDWKTLKRITYIGLFLIAPANAFFLYELYPTYFNKKIIDAAGIFGVSLAVWSLFVSPRVSYSIVPYHHIYTIGLGIYLLIALIRVAKDNVFGARFLLIGYFVAFLAATHDILSDHYFIQGYAFDMIHLGMIVYIMQMVIILGGRYIYALNSKEQLSLHLKKVNQELEEIVKRRTKDLRDQNKLIEEKNKELKKVIIEKDHLMAVVAHDLKAPLTSIMGITDILKSELKGQSAEFNEMIKKVSLDGRKLIEDFTELKVYEQEDFSPELTELDLNQFFEKKRVSYEEIADKKDIQLISNLETQSGYFVTDESILSRIIDNLLSNAIKFTPKKGEVRFELKEVANALTIEIKDNGPGFSDRDKARMFEKFQRLSARPTGGESSTGLGLSIVKTLVDILEASLEWSSEAGQGAKFTIIVPASTN